MTKQPTKSATAEAYEQTKRAYWEAFSLMNSSRFIGSGYDHLSKVRPLLELAEIEAYILEKIEATNKAFELLKKLQTAEMVNGKHDFYEYERKLGEWAEGERNREAYEKAPELYTIHAVAVKKVIREAQLSKRFKWNSLENYYLPKAVFATVNGLTLDEAEKALDDYIEARQMSYTVLTKSLKMKVA